MPTVVYNGQTLPNVFGKTSFSENEKELHFSCQFLASSTTASGLVSDCQTYEEKLTEINKDFSLTFGGTSEWNLTHSGNTGYNARPTLNKIANDLATETSRAYSFSVTIGLPFPQTGYYGRREGSFSVSYDPSKRRTVSFNCLYTCLAPSSSALTNYNAVTGGAKWWAASILATFGGTYEIVSESTHEDQERKQVNGTLVYHEILSAQSTSGTDDTSIVEPQLSISVNYEQETNMSSVPAWVKQPKVRVSANYSCKIDKTVVTTEATIEDVYQTRVKPLIIDKIYDYLGLDQYTQTGRNYIVESEQKSLNPYDWSISASLSMLVLKTTTQIIELEESIMLHTDNAIAIEKLWDGLPDTVNAWSTGGQTRMIRVITIAQLDVEPTEPPLYEWPGKRMIFQSWSKRRQQKQMGGGTPEITKSGGRTKWSMCYIVTFTENYFVAAEAGGANFVGVQI